MSTHLSDDPSTLTPAVNTAGTRVKRRILGTIRLRTEPTRSSEPELPHERDESVGMTDGIPSESVQQAYRDVKRGLQDTDRGAEAGRTYQKLKR